MLVGKAFLKRRRIEALQMGPVVRGLGRRHMRVVYSGARVRGCVGDARFHYQGGARLMDPIRGCVTRAGVRHGICRLCRGSRGDTRGVSKMEMAGVGGRIYEAIFSRAGHNCVLMGRRLRRLRAMSDYSLSVSVGY